jgi:N-methylhydantoinase A/oxoprolinase/acetone carboxylase beta subunit
MGRWFFHNSLQAAHPHLETTIRLKVPIIGIGAPAKIFLERVADIFHTELILPPYYWVANAVGAVAGSVMVSEEALVYARLSEDQSEVVGYYVQTSEGRTYYESLEEALGYARQRVRTLAWEGAVRAGAHSPQVTLEEVEDGLDTYRIRARAMGTPRLA